MKGVNENHVFSHDLFLAIMLASTCSASILYTRHGSPFVAVSIKPAYAHRKRLPPPGGFAALL